VGVGSIHTRKSDVQGCAHCGWGWMVGMPCTPQKIEEQKRAEEERRRRVKEEKETKRMAHEDERAFLIEIKARRWAKLVDRQRKALAVAKEERAKAREARKKAREEGFEYEYASVTDFTKWIASPGLIKAMRGHTASVYDCDVSADSVCVEPLPRFGVCAFVCLFVSSSVLTINACSHVVVVSATSAQPPQTRR